MTLRRQDIAALVEDDRVHRDVYLSPEVFALEQQHLLANTWQFAGHASQVPEAGDWVAVDIAGQPLLLVRQPDGALRVLRNRCPHKGSPLVTEASGHVARMFRCPYHSWTFQLDGAPLGMPMKQAYAASAFADSPSAQGITALRHVAVYRDFVFVKLSDAGLPFEEHAGPVLAAIDNLVQRSPVGRLSVAGGVLRNIIHCNWKMYLENINDTVHPLSTHESATAAARVLWQGQAADAPKPMAMEQILPFGNGLDFFDGMGARTLPHGHSVLGTQFSIHSGYSQLPDYAAAMEAAYGVEQARQILQQAPQNAVLYPSLAVKGSPQAIRVIRPLAADKMLLEAWSFRPEGAPEVLFQRSMMYNRLVFSPMSVVAHDDAHLFQGMQQALRADGNPWVSLHRDHRPGAPEDGVRDVNGTNEALMRNQFRAWRHFMTLTMAD